MSDIMVPVSIGELVDKITILRIKSQMIKKAEKLSHIKAELTALIKVCHANDIDLDNQLVDELQNVNLKLWKIEDDIRLKEKAKAFDDEFVDLARAVYRVNDQRFEAKSNINEHYGSQLREEKSYEDYD